MSWMIYWELFWSFVKVGAFCVGGGYASMPLIQAQVIEEHGWLTMQQFIDIFTISQMTPGPIGINAKFIEGKLFLKVNREKTHVGSVHGQKFLGYSFNM